MSTNSPIRVAVLGYGLAGAVFHAPLIAAVPEMQVTGIVTTNAERQRQATTDFPNAKIYSTADALWADAANFDLAVVATPNLLHTEQAVAAMEHGLTVVIDKPMVVTTADLATLKDASSRTGQRYTPFQSRRWDGDFLTLRRIIFTDTLGPIVRLESRMDRYRPVPKPDAWRELTTTAMGGGLLFDLGSHLIDQATQLFGTPETVYAELPHRRPGSLVDDDSFVALHFASGVDAHLYMSQVARIAGPRYVARGLHGTYEKFGVDPQEDALRKGERPGMPNWGHEPQSAWGRIVTEQNDLLFHGHVETLPGAYEQYYQHVADAIRTGDALPVDPDDAALTMRIIIAAQHSASEHGLVSLAAIH